MDDPADPHGERHDDTARFQLVARIVDEAISTMLSDVVGHADVDPLAVLSGAVMASTRLCIQHGLDPDIARTQRNVLTAMIKAVNQAADRLLETPPKLDG